MGLPSLSDILGAATEYAPLIKTGVAALSTYASYKDQQKKNQMQQAAYDDYIRDVAAAGDEASAAVALNLTPMTVSGVPTTKADVTDFTAVAAHGGLMSIPNKQRKRYAKGPEVFDVETMDEEVITPLDLQQETGIDLTGEQAKYDQGSPRKNAEMVWGNMGTGDKEPYNFDFEIFFQSGDWIDMIKSEIGGGGDTQVASAPHPDENWDALWQDLHEKGEVPESIRNLQEFKNWFHNQDFDIDMSQRNRSGIMQAAQGGRIGYSHGGNGYKDYLQDLKDGLISPDTTFNEWLDDNAPDPDHDKIYAKGGRIGYNIGQLVTPGPGRPGYGGGDTYHFLLEEEMAKIAELKDIHVSDLSDADYEKAGKRAYEKYHSGDWGGAKGGRVKYATGSEGIMDLGGLEKDYRTTGGFVPIGAYEKKDDVPARLSKNEFVMTADAVRAAGGGSINRGAQRMYDTMKHLEASPTAKRMTA